MFTSVPSGSAHADAVPLPGLLFYWCQDYIIMKRRHEKTDREAKRVPPPSRLPFRNVLLTASDGCYCWCWCCCWRWLVSCLMDKHRPRRPTNHGRPVPFWSLIALSFCCLFFASGQSSSFAFFFCFLLLRSSPSSSFTSKSAVSIALLRLSYPYCLFFCVFSWQFASGTNGNCNSVFAFISVPLLIYI